MTAATGFKLLQYLLKEGDPVSTDQWLLLANGYRQLFVGWGVIAWFMTW